MFQQAASNPPDQPWSSYSSQEEWEAKLPRPGQRVEGTPDGSYCGLVGPAWFVESDQPGWFTIAKALTLRDGTRHAELGLYAAGDIRQVGTPRSDPDAVTWLLAEIRRLRELLRETK